MDLAVLLKKIFCARARVLFFFCNLINQSLSENGINLNSSQQKDNFLITTSHSIDNFNNNNLTNLNSYAKSTTITSTNAPSNQSPSPTGHYQRQSPTSLEHQLRIFIPNYDDLLDNIRGQQPHSSRGPAGGSGMSSDRRNMMGDRRMNSSMMDRQMVR